MTIIVKKPFEPEPFDVKSIKDINTKDINAANEQQIHPEFEEKPIVESTTQTSEDVHGGSELTFSLPNSSQSNEQEQQQNGTSSPNNTDTNNDNAQEQQNAGGEKSNDNNETSDADKQSNEGGGDSSTNDTQGSQSTANDTNEQSAQEQENANIASSGDNQDSEGDNGNNNNTEDQGQDENGSENASTDDEPGSSVDNGDGDTNDANADEGSNGDNEAGDTSQSRVEENGDNEQNSENDGGDDDESDESEDTDDEQSQSGVYNTQQVVDVVNAISASSKYYQTEFWRLIELIAEEKTRAYDPMGSEEYNIKKLMFRPYEKKPLSSYKMSRVRESVVILLDNSGSMRWWSDNLQILADLAMQRNDVEVYLAPNGHIEEMLYPKYQLVNHDDVIKRLRNRKIIYVGDFDGADTPIMLSWYNDVIWVCPEERYLNFLDHDWVHYSEDRFKGAFLRVFTLQELFSAFKKLLSTPALKIWYDLCNETHRCGGDEE